MLWAERVSASLVPGIGMKEGPCSSTATSTSARAPCSSLPTTPTRRRGNCCCTPGTHGFSLPGYPWYHPTGWTPRTLRPAEPRSAPHSIDLDQVREQVLDAHDVTFGLATPDPSAADAACCPPPWSPPSSRARTTTEARAHLDPEPRLRGLIAISAQNPHEAAREIRRVGGRDEFAGIFLPGGARIPYGNPVLRPDLGGRERAVAARRPCTRTTRAGHRRPVTAAGYPDFYVEYHTLCGSGMYGHFVSILCHGIFERFPNVKVMMSEGGLVPFVGLLWRLDTNWKACKSEIPWCRRLPRSTCGSTWSSPASHSRRPRIPRCSSPRSRACGRGTTSASRATTRTGTTTSPHQTLRTLPAEWRENVAWRNAAEFYRLPVPAVVCGDDDAARDAPAAQRGARRG